MLRFKNINDTFDYDNIVFGYPFKIEELDLNDYDFFFQYKREYRDSFFTCKETEESIWWKNNYGIDEDDYVRVGDFLLQGESCDNEWSYSIWLRKINSSEFLQKLVKKLDEYQSELDEDFTFQDFMEWTEYDDFGVHSIEQFYEHLGGNLDDLEEIYFGLDIDDKANLIDRHLWEAAEGEYLELGYRKKVS